MSGEGVPSRTPDQVALFDAIAAGEVHGYPGWLKPTFFRKRSMLDETEVPRANRLLGAGLVAWEPLWCDGADRQSSYLLEPTEDGRQWRERCRAHEERAAARRDRGAAT